METSMTNSNEPSKNEVSHETNKIPESDLSDDELDLIAGGMNKSDLIDAIAARTDLSIASPRK
jgi:hypothetical protein